MFACLHVCEWLSKMASLRFKGVKKGSKLKKAVEARHDCNRQCKIKGHTTVILDASMETPDASKRPGRQWWCCSCLHLVAGYGVSAYTPPLPFARAKKRQAQRIAMV